MPWGCEPASNWRQKLIQKNRVALEMLDHDGGYHSVEGHPPPNARDPLAEAWLSEHAHFGVPPWAPTRDHLQVSWNHFARATSRDAVLHRRLVARL